jgi:hypothetical protein
MFAGLYEVIVQEALEDLHPGPWTAPDLRAVESCITDEFCERFGPECDPETVLAWLRALSAEKRRQVIERANDVWRRMDVDLDTG